MKNGFYYFTSSNQHLAQNPSTMLQSSYSSRCRPRSSDDENRFVYGRYRPTNNRHQPHSPHQFSHSHSHSHHPSHGRSSQHSSHTHLHQDEEGLYESADPVRNSLDIRDVNDSER